ncbi:MAG: thiamine pyrophosphate-binding protein [Methanomassiliicoccales archaeon]
MVFRDTVAEVLVENLQKWGVKRIFGIPGDAINTIMDAVRKTKDIEFVLVRHEEAAAFAASAEAKLTGRLAACVGTAGPGAIHLLNGLYEAKLSGVPVIAMTGQVDSDLIGTGYFQEVDLIHLFSDVSVYNQRISSAGEAPSVIEAACRNAVARRGVAHLSFPLDIPRMEIPKKVIESSFSYTSTICIPPENDLERAAEVLNASSRCMILAGGGARACTQELNDISEKLASPVSVTLPGKGALPDDHKNCLGGLGLIGTQPSQEAMEEADTVLLIGTSYPYTQFLPKDAKFVQIDNDPANLGRRVPVTIGLRGDASMTLQRLIPLLKEKQDRSFLEKYRQKMTEWREKMDKDCNDMKSPIRPQIAARALSDVLPEDAIVCGDVGNVTVWIARYFNAKRHKFIFSPWLGSMGVALPSAIGAKLEHPDKAVAAFAGDGGFGMLMADFCTAVKYNLPIVCVVINNGILGMIRFEQEVMGHPKFGIDLHNPDFSKYAEACGGVGIRVEKAEEVKDAIAQAYKSGKPAVVEIMADPDERPMPPKIMATQAFHYATALFREKFES